MYVPQFAGKNRKASEAAPEIANQNLSTDRVEISKPSLSTLFKEEEQKKSTASLTADNSSLPNPSFQPVKRKNRNIISTDPHTPVKFGKKETEEVAQEMKAREEAARRAREQEAERRRIQAIQNNPDSTDADLLEIFDAQEEQNS